MPRILYSLRSAESAAVNPSSPRRRGECMPTGSYRRAKRNCCMESNSARKNSGVFTVASRQWLQVCVKVHLVHMYASGSASSAIGAGFAMTGCDPAFWSSSYIFSTNGRSAVSGPTSPKKPPPDSWARSDCASVSPQRTRADAYHALDHRGLERVLSCKDIEGAKYCLRPEKTMQN